MSPTYESLLLLLYAVKRKLPGNWHTPPSMRFEFYTELVSEAHQMRIRTSTHVWQIRNPILYKTDETMLFLLISCTTRTSCFGCLVACHCFNFVFNPFASQFSFHFLPYTAHTIFPTLYIRYSLQWWISFFLLSNSSSSCFRVGTLGCAIYVNR